MPRDGSGIYALPTGTIAVSGTKVSSAAYNTFLADMVSTLNGIQPVALGGTGQVSIEGFRTAYSLYSKAETDAKLTGYLPNKDSTDATKVLAFNISGFTTATTRTIIIPNSDGTMMLNTQYPTAVSLEGLTLAAGDILYATAENTLQRLPIGSNGEVLKVASGLPDWVTSDGWNYIPDVATTSGTSTSAMTIGTDATEIEISFFGVSLVAGTGHVVVRIGPSGGVESTGYISSSASISPGATDVVSGTSGFAVFVGTAGGTIYGIMKLSRSNSNSSAWASSHSCFRDTGNVSTGGGVNTITGTIGKLTVAASGDTFDGGSVAVRWR